MGRIPPPPPPLPRPVGKKALKRYHALLAAHDATVAERRRRTRYAAIAGTVTFGGWAGAVAGGPFGLAMATGFILLAWLHDHETTVERLRANGMLPRRLPTDSTGPR